MATSTTRTNKKTTTKTAGKNKVKQTVKKVVAKTLAKTLVKAKTTASGLKTAAKKAVGKSPAKSSSALQPGNAAPGFELQDDSGRVVSLGDFRGKKVVLYFYPKDNTSGCTRESCDFRDNLSRLGEKGAIVLGLSADSVESHRKFKARQGLNFPLLSDPERRALEAYGVWQEKSLYGRKFMGIVRTTVIIDEKGKVAKVFPKVKVEGHVDEVLSSL